MSSNREAQVNTNQHAEDPLSALGNLPTYEMPNNRDMIPLMYDITNDIITKDVYLDDMIKLITRQHIEKNVYKLPNQEMYEEANKLLQCLGVSELGVSERLRLPNTNPELCHIKSIEHDVVKTYANLNKPHSSPSKKSKLKSN